MSSICVIAVFKAGLLLKKMDLRELTEFMAMTLTAGIFFPPRRSSEWVEMKIKDYDPETDNYLDMAHNQFVINKHKEVRVYGRQIVKFEEEFRNILLKYIEMTKMRKDLTETQRTYLITNTDGGKLTESSLSNMLNRVFGKKISTTMLRHIYKSYQYESMPSLKNMREDAEKMGHGLIVSLQYAKKMDV
jgi:site-specific recombinase XerD